MTPLPEDKAWFTQARFGMFIHWGAYSVAARHEWLKTQERLTDVEYQKYLDHFEPDLFDPEAWADLAARAGMRYLVFTTKHHDGFCLWDSDITDYKAPNTPASRDLLRPTVDAFRSKGLRVGFYHSVIDWHHPDFPIDGLHPLRDDEQAKTEARDIRKYATYLYNQLEELLTRYGTIDVLWFDFSYPERDWGWSQGKGQKDWQADRLLELIKTHQPQALINNRLDVKGDFVTPEQTAPLTGMERDGGSVTWENCFTLSGSWTYRAEEREYKSTEQLVKLLIDTVSKGGNLLLNVAPNARGEIDSASQERLRSIGEWMRLHSRSIYGATASTFVPPPDCRYTQKNDRLYLHLFDWPLGQLHLRGLAGKVAFARTLHDHAEVHTEVIDSSNPAFHDHVIPVVPPGTLTITLPGKRPDVTVPVVEIFLTED